MIEIHRLRSWRQRTSSDAAGLQVGLSGIVLLITDGSLHLLHAAGIDLPFVSRLIPIPLFQHAIVAAAVALASIAASWPLVRGGRVPFRWLPAAFLVGPGLFSIGIALFP